MQTLVSGATGTLGSAIVTELLAAGRTVRCLVRNLDAARAILPATCEFVLGDVTDQASIHAAMDGCSAVFHASGLAEQWLPDTSLFDRVNVGGTRHMVEAALATNVQSFVYTSTQDLFDFTLDSFDETNPQTRSGLSPYEQSKKHAEDIVLAALDRGLPARFAHPVAIYGPVRGRWTGLNHFLLDLYHNKVPLLLPGGFPVVLNQDCARGHLLIEERGPIGEHFILSESYQTLRDIAKEMASIETEVRVPRMMPGWTARAIAFVGEFVSKLTQKPPIISSGELSVLRRPGRPSSHKARTELGWQTTSFGEGLKATLSLMRENKLNGS